MIQLSRRAFMAGSGAAAWPAAARAASTVPTYDVFIYGANLGGMMAAARLGLHGYSVFIAEPTGFVGGMTAAGLSLADIPGDPALIGGLTAAFFAGIGDHYGYAPFAYGFEPHVALHVAQDTLQRVPRCTVRVNARILAASDVLVQGLAIREVRTAAGTVRARMFIDASYTGDLMAGATRNYTFGREPAAQYGETLAGFQPAGAEFVHGFAPNTLFPVGPHPQEAAGAGDRKTMAYSFRFVLTDQPANRIPFPKPAGYNREYYALFLQDVKLHGYADLPTIVQQSGLMPAGKINTNVNTIISMDLPGVNWSYPDGSWTQRDAIIQEVLHWDLGLLYFLANDPDVPAPLRASAASWGFCADEFQDSPYGPGVSHNIYERETRRLVGAYVFTQADQSAPNNVKATSIGRYYYPRDCHQIQMYAGGTDTVIAEGGLPSIPVDPFQYPAECLMPAPGDIQNLLVLFCGSHSHVGFSTVRLEPFLGIQGEAAGEIAAQCLSRVPKGAAALPVQHYDYPSLLAALLAYGSVV